LLGITHSADSKQLLFRNSKIYSLSKRTDFKLYRFWVSNKLENLDNIPAASMDNTLCAKTLQDFIGKVLISKNQHLHLDGSHKTI